MICKNCGLEIQDNARFCNHCGAEQTVPQNNEEPVQATSSQEAAESVENQPQEAVAPQQENSTQEIPAPVEYKPQGVPEPQPKQESPAPVQYQPQSAVPQQTAPVNGAGSPGETAQYTSTEKQPSMFQPMIDTFKSIDFKKLNPKTNPKPTIIAGAVIVVLVLCIVVGNIISNSGVKGLVNNMEKAINDNDKDALEDCYPDFVVEDDSYPDISSIIGYEGIEVEFEIVNEKDITDEDYEYDSSYTWQQYIENDYSEYEDYDGEKVTKVEKLKLKFELDTGSSLVDYLAGAINTTLDVTAVKVDGDWCIYDTDTSY